MINGAHVIIYSKDAEADRAFFKDVLGFPHVDAGHGWLIFALPPAEVACHPAEENDRHQLYLMCEDLKQNNVGAGCQGDSLLRSAGAAVGFIDDDHSAGWRKARTLSAQASNCGKSEIGLTGNFEWHKNKQYQQLPN